MKEKLKIKLIFKKLTVHSFSLKTAFGNHPLHRWDGLETRYRVFPEREKCLSNYHYKSRVQICLTIVWYMCVWVCVRACMCLCVHVRARACIYLCWRRHVYMSTFVEGSFCLRVCMCTCVEGDLCGVCVYLCERGLMWCVHVCVCVVLAYWIYFSCLLGECYTNELYSWLIF